MMAERSDETLNAFVEGELRARESEALLAALCRDADLRRRVAEVHVVRALIRHAYRPAAPVVASASGSGYGVIRAREWCRSRAMLAAIAMLLASAMLAAWVVVGCPLR